MELKRRSHFALLKKLTAFLICFCLLMFILFNYICSETQCYWKANRYHYSRGRFFAKQQASIQVNRTALDQFADQTYGPTNLVPFGESDRLSGRSNVGPAKLNSTNRSSSGSSNKSDQLISAKRKSRIVNLPERSVESSARFKYLNLIDRPSNRVRLRLNQVSYDQLMKEARYRFDFLQDDVLIFLHIQKTGGTAFGKRLVGDLQLEKPCECFKDRKHCSCIRPSWSDDLTDLVRLQATSKTVEKETDTNTTAHGVRVTINSQNLFSGTNEINEINGSKPTSLYRQTSLIRQTNLIQPTSQPGKSKTKSKSKYWLFSRYSTGWICGLHADWTQLNYCADDALNRIEKVKLKRRFFFITILRDPVARFLSEYSHVRRGATWRASRFACSTDGGGNDNSNELTIDKNPENVSDLRGRQGKPEKDRDTASRSTSSPSVVQLNVSFVHNSVNSSRCYSGDDWRGVDLEEYTNCDTNLAINRQTRMLADLSKVGCGNNGNRSEYDRALLESAKYNLKRLAYFGLLEYQKISQFVFESTFNVSFEHSFLQLNQTHASQIKTDPKTVQLIQQLNSLDMELYAYARKLLFKRFEQSRKANNFEEFESSKRNSLDNLKQNLDRFPELRLFQKFSKLDKDL